MLSSKAVRIGTMTSMLVASLACGSSEQTQTVQTEYGEICVRQEPSGDMTRVPWEECSNDPDHVHTHPYYVNHGGGHAAPAVGSKVAPGSGISTRPASGTVSQPAGSGGFGTHTSVIGG